MLFNGNFIFFFISLSIFHVIQWEFCISSIFHVIQWEHEAQKLWCEGGTDGCTDGRTYRRHTSGNSPLYPTGHRPFGATAQKVVHYGIRALMELGITDFITIEKIRFSEEFPFFPLTCHYFSLS